MELKEMSVPDLIEQAQVRGLRTRGMTRDEIIEAIESTDAGRIVNTGDDVPKSARYEELEARIAKLEEKVGMNITEPVAAMQALSWADLKKLAKQSGIQVYGKKRNEIEAELRRIEDK